MPVSGLMAVVLVVPGDLASNAEIEEVTEPVCAGC